VFKGPGLRQDDAANLRPDALWFSLNIVIRMHGSRLILGSTVSRQPCVYILASRRNGTIYIGVTSDLAARLHQHRTGTLPGFASKYRVARLVHFEMLGDMYAAIAREKQLKNWHRAWKVALIEEGNPFWEDRAVELGFDALPPHPSTLASPSRT
jgi:putative endonuclease